MFYCVNLDDVPKSRHSVLFNQYYSVSGNRVYRDYSGRCYLAFVTKPTGVDDSVISQSDPGKLRWTEISPEDIGRAGEDL
jgi:hypothetical protein